MDSTDIFVGRQTTECFEPPGVIVAVDKGVEMGAQLVVTVVIIPL